jgi:hypothetical protein
MQSTCGDYRPRESLCFPEYTVTLFETICHYCRSLRRDLTQLSSFGIENVEPARCNRCALDMATAYHAQFQISITASVLTAADFEL